MTDATTPNPGATSQPPASAPQSPQRRRLINVLDRETATTLKVLHAYPGDQGDLKPHPRSTSARDLCWLFAMELQMMLRAVRGDEELFKRVEAPDDFGRIVSEFERAREDLLSYLRTCDDAELSGTVQFPTGPGTMGDWPITDFLWLMLHDQIHHRGQLSVYLRMAGGKVPSIYGPSADEPWF